MFTLQINYKYKGIKKNHYYCKKYKGMFVLSNDVCCALKFKSIGTAKRSFNAIYKSQLLNKHRIINGYDINIIT